MYDPKDILTEGGYEMYSANLVHLDDILFYITCHGDDLRIGEDEMETMYNLQRMIPLLKKGDGEQEEEYTDALGTTS